MVQRKGSAKAGEGTLAAAYEHTPHPPRCVPGWQPLSCCPQPSEPWSWKRATTKRMRENRAPDQVGEHCFQLLRDESEFQVPGARSSVRTRKCHTGYHRIRDKVSSLSSGTWLPVPVSAGRRLAAAHLSRSSPTAMSAIPALTNP